MALSLVRVRRAILLAFVASGAAGLIFQIAWMRQLGHVVGNTTQSAALVTAVFVLGLGIGARLAGPIADKLFAKHPTRLLGIYAGLELFIGAWGVLLSYVLPKLAASPFPPAAYTTDASGFHSITTGSYALQALVAVLLLVPPTIAMGATLVVLVRAIVSAGVAAVALGTGALYAANTAGASAGSFAVDAIIVPSIGVSGAQAVAAMLNFIAAAVALRMKNGDVQVDHDDTPTGPAPSLRRYASLIAAVFIAGFVGMGIEIVWFRYLASLLGAHRATFSLVLTVVLLGIWMGSAACGYLIARTKRPLALFVAVQCFLVIAAVLGVLLSGGRPDEPGLAAMLARVVVVVGPASLCLGTSFVLANAALHSDISRGASIGRIAGLVYLANTLGGVIGSLSAGFILIPLLGMQRAFIAMLIASLCAAAIILRRAIHEGGRSSHLAWAAAGVVAVIIFVMAPPHLMLDRIYSRKDVSSHLLLYSEDVGESIAITERTDLGSEPQRILYVDGALMSGTLAGPQRYMRLLAHLPLLQLEAPKNVLVICFGVGNTAHAASLHPIERLEIVDLSRQILQHGHLFETWNRGVLKDPRTRVYVQDGRHHLRMHDTRYDLITLEPPPIAQAGVGALYSRELYALALSKLNDGGFITQWLPAYQVDASSADSLVRAFVDVFPDAVMISGFERHLLLIGRRGAPNTVDPEALARILEARPDVKADLARWSLATPRQILGTFVSDGASLKRATEHVPPVTDDWPINEYSSLITRAETPLNKGWFNVDTIDTWCPRCSEVDGLKEQLAFLGAWYASEHFRIARGATRPPPMTWSLADPDGAIRRVVDGDPYLSSLFGAQK